MCAGANAVQAIEVQDSRAENPALTKSDLSSTLWITSFTETKVSELDGAKQSTIVASSVPCPHASSIILILTTLFPIPIGAELN